MLIDDHVLLRETVSRYLELRCAAVVTSVPNGEVAWRTLLTLHPAIVITDVELPGGIDGLTLTRQICVHYPAMAVLVYSATPDYRAAAEAAGARAFFWKTDRAFFAELCATIRTLA